MSSQIASNKLVLEMRVGHNSTLSHHAHTVHVVRTMLFNAVPMNSSCLKGMQCVEHVHDNNIALTYLNRWTWQHAIYYFYATAHTVCRDTSRLKTVFGFVLVAVETVATHGRVPFYCEIICTLHLLMVGERAIAQTWMIGVV